MSEIRVSTIEVHTSMVHTSMVTTNYPHHHMTRSGRRQYRRYQKLKARILRSKGLELWCKHCDNMCAMYECLQTALTNTPNRRDPRQRFKRQQQQQNMQPKSGSKRPQKSNIAHKGQLIQQQQQIKQAKSGSKIPQKSNIAHKGQLIQQQQQIKQAKSGSKIPQKSNFAYEGQIIQHQQQIKQAESGSKIPQKSIITHEGQIIHQQQQNRQAKPDSGISNKLSFLTRDGEIIKTLVTQKNPEVYSVKRKSTKPYIIPHDNSPDLPDAAEKLVAPLQLVSSKIKININKKPAASSTKVNDNQNKVEGHATAAAIHISDAEKSDFQIDSIYVIDSLEPSTSIATDDTDAAPVTIHTSRQTVSKTVIATESTLKTMVDNNLIKLTQSKQHLGYKHSTEQATSIPSLLDIDCTATNVSRNDSKSKASASASIKNIQSVESGANKMEMALPTTAPGLGFPRFFNYEKIGKTLKFINKYYGPSGLAHATTSQRTPLASEMPDLVMSVHPSKRTEVQVQKNDGQVNEPNEFGANAENVDSEEKIVPIGEREEINRSVDPSVLMLVQSWPWPLRSVGVLSNLGLQNRHSSQTMLRKEFRAMLEKQDLHGGCMRVRVTGYPKDWTRLELLDKLISWQPLHRIPLVPAFIEFTQQACDFLLFDCTNALNKLFMLGLVVPGDGWRLDLAVHQLRYGRPIVNFRLQSFLEDRLRYCYARESQTLDLTEFLLEPDISMFCHFPLNNAYNQQYIMQIDDPIQWKLLTTLVLAGNRLKCIEYFGLRDNLPVLQKLDLSNNWLESVSTLACCRGMFSIESLRLEGNPLCHNFIDQDSYTDTIKLLFPRIVFLDSVRIVGLPNPVRNFCPETSARPLVEQFLEMFFALIESNTRGRIADMYSADAMLTVSCQPKLKKNPDYEHIDLIRVSRDIRQLNTIEESCIVGCDSIAQHLSAWLPVCHDPYSFTVDVLSHTERETVLMVSGSLRVLSRPLHDECPLFDFARTLALRTSLGELYRVTNDMLHLAEPTPLRGQAVLGHPRRPTLSLQLESAPSEDLANDLVSILMNLTKHGRSRCSRCLELRDWNLRAAIQYFSELVQDDKLSTLDDPVIDMPC